MKKLIITLGLCLSVFTGSVFAKEITFKCDKKFNDFAQDKCELIIKYKIISHFCKSKKANLKRFWIDYSKFEVINNRLYTEAKFNEKKLRKKVFCK